ncbi:MAG: hypothetical protein QM764_09005 [Chitinophagaceae bacterium]
MIKLNFRTSLLLFILGFVCGCSFSYMVFGKTEPIVTKHETITPSEFARQTKKLEESYQLKLAELESSNDSLLHRLIISNRSLNSIKAQTKRKARAIKAIIHPEGYPARELLKRAPAPLLAVNPTISPCDSLIAMAESYISDNEIKDSLYETTLRVSDSIIIVKDSIIALNNIRQDELKQSLSIATQKQEQVLSENKLLRKQIKRRKFKSKLAALGAAILAGLSANYLIHH